MRTPDPRAGMYVTLLTQRRADEHARRVHNVPEGVGLGWRPYTVLVTEHACAVTAFHSLRDFRRWLGDRYRLNLSAAWHFPGIRSGRIESKGGGNDARH